MKKETFVFVSFEHGHVYSHLTERENIPGFLKMVAQMQGHRKYRTIKPMTCFIFILFTSETGFTGMQLVHSYSEAPCSEEFNALLLPS
jgi:hypothetical protein